MLLGGLLHQSVKHGTRLTQPSHGIRWPARQLPLQRPGAERAAGVLPLGADLNAPDTHRAAHGACGKLAGPGGDLSARLDPALIGNIANESG